MRVERFSFKSFHEPVEEKPAQTAAFEALQEVKVVPPPPPLPTYSEEDLKAAEKRGFDMGYAAGQKAGGQAAVTEQSQISQQLHLNVQQLLRALESLNHTYHQYILEQQALGARLAGVIAHKLAGRALEKFPAQVVEALVAETLPLLAGRPDISITAHPSVCALLESSIRQLAVNHQLAEIQILSDAGMSPADCRIQWKNGEISRESKAIWQEVERVMQRHIETLAMQLPGKVNNMASGDAGQLNNLSQ